MIEDYRQDEVERIGTIRTTMFALVMGGIGTLLLLTIGLIVLCNKDKRVSHSRLPQEDNDDDDDSDNKKPHKRQESKKPSNGGKRNSGKKNKAKKD